MTAEAEDRSAIVRAQGGRLPDFFIVGHAKSGTTALYRMLRAQPRVFMPTVKEPWFFVPELRADNRRLQNAQHPNTLEEYEALFVAAEPQQLLGEATPSYLLSTAAAGRIAELVPDARIIAVLREPASFLRSLHLQFLETHVEAETDLGTAIGLEPSRREGKRIPAHSTRPRALLYSEHVRYVEQLRRYHEAFGKEQVLVLIYDDFRADNEGTVRRVLDFLGVEQRAPIEAIEANPTVSARSQRMRSGIRQLYRGGGRGTRLARKTIKVLSTRRVRREALRVSEQRLLRGEAPPVDERVMRELRVRFKPEVVALSDYLDRDLVTLWGYDGLD